MNAMGSSRSVWRDAMRWTRTRETDPPPGRSARAAIAHVDDAIAERAGLHELEVLPGHQRREERRAAAGHDGGDPHPVLVDEVLLGRGGGEPGAADADVSAGLGLQAGDLPARPRLGPAGGP